MLSAEWRVLRLVLIVAFAATPAVVSAQDTPTVASAQSTPAVVPAQDTTMQPSGTKAFVSDVFHDYWNFISDIDNARLAAAGIVVSGTAHFADKHLAEDVGSNPGSGLSPGATYGNLAFQFPLAVTWWIVGHAMGSDNGADAGRDLVRAQISAASFTYAVKYAVNRTRPNGDPRSFPSGHASASFATAMVLEEHYGWKLGVPAFAVATYVGSERIRQNKHWLSDVTFGATLGLIAGRTVTLHLKHERLSISPHAIPGGAAVLVHVQE
jgi:membrane-associated phospholipid phosphatase